MYELYQLLVQLDSKTKMDVRLEILPNGSGYLVDFGWTEERYVLREWNSFAEGIMELQKELTTYK